MAEAVSDSGLDGIICSAEDLPGLSGGSFISWQKIAKLLKITPGIRLADGSSDDQKRVATPRAAIANGADYLVVGRPILNPELGNSIDALWKFVEDIKLGWADRAEKGGAQ